MEASRDKSYLLISAQWECDAIASYDVCAPASANKMQGAEVRMSA